MMWSITIALPYMEFMWQMYHKCKLDLTFAISPAIPINPT